MQIRTLLACIMLASLATACAHPQPQPQPAPPATSQPEATPTPPKLVVLVVVDQLPSWWFESKRAQFLGGIARLTEKGVYYPIAEYPYAVTFTAAGHAALGTGAPPLVTGVADNEKYDPRLSKEVATATDCNSPIFMLGKGPGKQPEDGRSGAALLVEGIADVLERETEGQARTVTISLKDRSAAFVAGRKPDLAIWYDETQAAMTTSAYYVSAAPEWLRDLASGDLVTKHRGERWTRKNGKADEFHERTAPKDLIPTPSGDLLVFDTAFVAIEAMDLGGDEVPDLLALSFSAHDYAGHNWGPDSWERLEIFEEFDKTLSTFLAKLDEQLSETGYALVLTSDHGVTPLVELSRDHGIAAYRVQRTAIEDRAEAAANAAFPGSAPRDWIAHVGDNSLYLRPGIDEPTRARALDAMSAAIKSMDGLAEAEKLEDIRGNCRQRTGFKQQACYSVVPKDPGDIYFAAKPKSIITKYPGGTNHGSPNPDDRQVPIIIYAPGSRRWNEKRTVNETVSPLQVAPTLAELLGISAPPAAKEKPLP